MKNYCGECGAKLTLGLSYCPQCGKTVIKENKEKNHKSIFRLGIETYYEQSFRQRIGWIIAIISLLLYLCGFIIDYRLTVVIIVLIGWANVIVCYLFMRK